MHSFSKRVLINDRKTRQLLGTYAKRGLSAVEKEEMMELLDRTPPFLELLLSMLMRKFNQKYISAQGDSFSQFLALHQFAL